MTADTCDKRRNKVELVHPSRGADRAGHNGTQQGRHGTHKGKIVPVPPSREGADRSATEGEETGHSIETEAGGGRAAPPPRRKGDAPRDQWLQRVFFLFCT